MARKRQRSEIWWLAHGHSSRSRQPSFAPPTARPVVSTSYYGFGWHRQKQCFVTRENRDIHRPERIKHYLCAPEVAQKILRQCAYKNVSMRFFDNPFAKEDDAEIFAAAGHMFGITLMKRYPGAKKYAEASLHFYAPDGTRQLISFHHGMTQSFGRITLGLNIAQIQAYMS